MEVQFVCKSTNEDGFTVLGRAIREYCEANGLEKLEPKLGRIMAKIVDTAFLESVLERQGELIDASVQRMEWAKSAERTALAQKSRHEAGIRVLEQQISNLTYEKKKIEDEIRRFDGTKLGDAEKDPALAGAKRAYDWILEKTRDTDRASRAFNSYLIGGKYQDEDTYSGDIVQIDAQKIIDEANEDISSTFYRGRRRRI